MSTDPQVALEEELDALQADVTEKVGELALNYSALKQLQTRVNAAVGDASRKLLEAMEEQGMTAVANGPVRVSVSQRRTIGIAEGQSPEDRLNYMEQARHWVEKYNPQQTSITVNTLKNTLEAYYEREGGDAKVPDFLKEQDVPTLSVRRST